MVNFKLLPLAFLISAVLGSPAMTFAASSSDKELMSTARTAYQNGKLDKAIEIYSKIKPESDFWLESIEERAWAQTRKGDFEKALADLHSITSPVLAPQVGPETYMLSTFVSLKICAYKDVTKKIAMFKKIMLPRVSSMEAILDSTTPDVYWDILKETKNKKVSLISLGKQADKMPRYFFRDKKLTSYVNQNNKNKSIVRLKELAQMDLDEIEVNLKKMKIIDVDLMQKVLTMEKELKKDPKGLKFASADPNTTMTFPVTDEELWIDEVGHYQVKANLCPKN